MGMSQNRDARNFAFFNAKHKVPSIPILRHSQIYYLHINIYIQRESCEVSLNRLGLQPRNDGKRSPGTIPVAK